MIPLNSFYEKYRTISEAPRNEAMKLELHRLSSFHKFPPHVRMSAVKLSKAGFYYTGFQDETACFTCDLKLQDWDDNLDPFEMHRNYSPHCPFVNNNIDNFPMGEIGPSRESFTLAQKASSVELLSGSHAQQSISGAFRSDFPLTTQGVGGVPSHSPPLQSDAHSLNNPTSQNFLREAELNNSRNGQSHDFAAGNLAHRQNLREQEGPFQRQGRDDVSTATANRKRPNWKKDYRYERSRLNSFRNWPSNAAIRPSSLAEAGFYYMGTDDRVQCVFCRGILRNWEPDDDAFSEHRRHFGQCPFLANPDDVGNVKIGQETFPVDDSGAVDEDLNVHAARNDVLPPAEDYCRGIVKDKPIHGMYALPADRLKTFRNFPSITQTPEQFTRAGFFYSGISDNVKCFFCDGGLRNWEPNDDPWTEHARWFPRCGYIRLCKGDEFIKEVQQKYAPPPVDSKPQGLRINRRVKKFKVDTARLTAILTSRTILSVIEMGWESDMVRQVVKRRLEDLDDDFPNVESLIDALQEYEHELKYIDTHGDSDHSNESKETNNDNDIPETEAAKEGSKKKNKKKKKKKKGGANNGDKEGSTEQGGANEDLHEPYQYIDDEEAKRLAEDIQRMKDERLCKVCMDEEVNIVFLRCGHLVCCSNCAPALRHCPICRELIRGTVRVFLS